MRRRAVYRRRLASRTKRAKKAEKRAVAYRKHQRRLMQLGRRRFEAKRKVGIHQRKAMRLKLKKLFK